MIWYWGSRWNHHPMWSWLRQNYINFVLLVVMKRNRKSAVDLLFQRRSCEKHFHPPNNWQWQESLNGKEFRFLCEWLFIGMFVFVHLSLAGEDQPNSSNRTMQAEFTIIKGTVKTKEYKTQSNQTDSISNRRNITTANSWLKYICCRVN